MTGAIANSTPAAPKGRAMGAMATNNDIIDLLRDVSAKQDKLVDRIGDIEKAAALDVANARYTMTGLAERMDALEQVMREDVKPQTDDLKRMKAIGIGFLTLVGMGGLTLGGTIVWASETLVQTLRAWLRIS